MDKLMNAHQFTNDVWKFYKQFANASNINSDEYWEAVVTAGTELDAKYGTNKHMHEIILDVLEALEGEANGEGQSNHQAAG